MGVRNIGRSVAAQAKKKEEEKRKQQAAAAKPAEKATVTTAAKNVGKRTSQAVTTNVTNRNRNRKSTDTRVNSGKPAKPKQVVYYRSKDDAKPVYRNPQKQRTPAPAFYSKDNARPVNAAQVAAQRKSGFKPGILTGETFRKAPARYSREDHAPIYTAQRQKEIDNERRLQSRVAHTAKYYRRRDDVAAAAKAEDMRASMDQMVNNERRRNRYKIEVDFNNNIWYRDGKKMDQKMFDETFPTGLANPEDRALAEKAGFVVNKNWYPTEEDKKAEKEQNKRIYRNWDKNAAYESEDVGDTDLYRLGRNRDIYNAAKAAGDKEAMARAHEENERIRARYGYSGGAAGDQQIRGEVDARKASGLNQAGYAALSMAALRKQKAVTEEEIAAAEQEEQRILNDPKYQSKLSPLFDQEAMQEKNKHQIRDLTKGAALQGIGNTAVMMREDLNMMKYAGAGNEYDTAAALWARVSALYDQLDAETDEKKREKILEQIDWASERANALSNAGDRLAADPSSPWFDEISSRHAKNPKSTDTFLNSGAASAPQKTMWDEMAERGDQLIASAEAGMSPGEKFAADLYANAIQMVPTTVAGLIPGAGEAAAVSKGAKALNAVRKAAQVGALWQMAESAGGARYRDLVSRGIPYEQARTDAQIAKAIEMGTESVPLHYLSQLSSGTNRLGKTALGALAASFAIEGTEEGIAYSANALWSWMRGYEEDKFSWAEMGRDMLAGGIMGGLHAGLGLAVNRAVTSLRSQGREQDAERVQAYMDDITGIMEQSRQYSEMVRQGALSEEEGAAIQSQLQEDLVGRMQRIRDHVRTIDSYQSMADQGILSQDTADYIRNTYGQEMTGQETISREAMQDAVTQRLYQAAMAANAIDTETTAQREARERTERAQRMYRRGQSVMGEYQADREAQLARDIREAQQAEPETRTEASSVEQAQQMGQAALEQARTALARAEAARTAIPEQEARQMVSSVPNERLEGLSRTMGEKGSQALMSIAGAENNSNLVRDFVRVYNQALSGNTGIEAPRSMTQAEFNRATEAGVADRMAGITMDMNLSKNAAGRNKNAGINRADPYVRGMDKQTVKTLDAFAKTIGAKIEFTEFAVSNGSFVRSGNVITIAKNNPLFEEDPVLYVMGHESTHRMQDLDVESYNAFRDYVMSLPGSNARLEKTLATYREANAFKPEENQRYAAMDEMTADFAGTLLRDQEELRQFIRDMQKPAVLRALANAFRAVRDFVTGREKAQTEEAIRLLEDAIKASSQRVSEMGTPSSARQNRGASPRIEGRDTTDEIAERQLREQAERLRDARAEMDRRMSVSEAEPALGLETTAEEAEPSTRYSLVTDRALLDELNRGETVTVYRAMQLIDGKLYPPMAAKVAKEAGKGKKRQFVEPTEFGAWYQSDERPDLATDDGFFVLDKGNGKTIKARYNPYFHTSATPLNDQFSSAYDRPNLVTVEAEIPVSELTSGYQAEKAKDPVGETKWHAGPVASKLKGAKARRVFLSRWAKVNRIVPDAEVARVVANTLKGEDVAVPTNVVTPSLLAELRKNGVKIEEVEGKGGARFSLAAEDERAGLAGENDSIDPPARYSLSSSADAMGFSAKINEKTGGVEFYRVNGKRVKLVTMRDVKKSKMYQLVDLARQNGTISAAEAEKQANYLRRLMNLVLKTNDSEMIYAFEGSMLWSAVKDNADKQYGMTIDFEAICKKTEQMVAAMSEAMTRMGRGLTLDEINELYGRVIEAGEPVPCPPCYVFTRWIGLGGLLDNIKNFQTEFEDTEAGTEKARKRLDEIREILSGEVAALRAEDDARVRKNLEAQARGEKKTKTDVTPKSDDDLTNQAKKDRLAELNKAEGKLITKRNKALDKLQFDDLSEGERRKVQASIDAIDAEYKQLTDQMRTLRMFSWLKDVRLSETYKEVPDSVLFNLRAGEEFASRFADTWAFRTGQGAYYGKAITPYTDMRTGEIIQGVHMAARNIKIGKANPFSGEFDAKNLTKKQADELESARLKVRQQNMRGGVRMQSVSDFRYEYGLDYIQAFFELQAIGAAIQTYSKVVEFVPMVASTGGFVNMSLIPWGNGFRNGKLAYSPVTGMDAEAAFKLQKQWDTAGTILIGVSDEHIRAAMADKNIYFIIPYHLSGGREDVIRQMLTSLGEKAEKYTDYSNVQSEKFPSQQNQVLALRNKILTASKTFEPTRAERALLDSNEFLRGLYDRKFNRPEDPLYLLPMMAEDTKHIYPYEYWDVNSTYKTSDVNGQRYLQWCEDLGVIPKFSGDKDGNKDFRNDKGYWKLLIDRRMYGRDGTYNPLLPINATGLSLNQLDRERAKQTFGEAMTAPADLRKTKEIVDKAFPETAGKRFSISPQADADYLSAVERGDMETAQRMVDEAAEKAGYTIKAYHGSARRHNVFDTDRGAGTTQYGPGTYFTDAKGLAEDWALERAPDEEDGYLGEYYINDADYFDDRSVDTGTPQWKRVEDILDFYGVTEKNMRVARARGFEGIAFALKSVGMIEDGRYAIYDWKNATKVNDVLREAGYKGIVGDFYDSTQWVIFDPSEAKSAGPVTYDDDGNVIPLSERFNEGKEDIRYSLGGSEQMDAVALMRENQLLKDRLETWRKGQGNPESTKVSDKTIRDLAARLANEYRTELPKAEIAEAIRGIYDRLGDGAPFDKVYQEANALAARMVEQAADNEDHLYTAYKELRDHLRGKEILVSKELKDKIPGYNTLRQSMMGRAKLKNGEKTNVDAVFAELAEMWPEFFDQEIDATQAAKLERIGEVLQDVYNRDETEAPGLPEGYLATEILASYFDSPAVRASMAKKAGARAEAMRARHKERYDAALEKARIQKDKELKRKSERYLSAKKKNSAKQKERELRAKIMRHAKKLSTKLLRPTDTQHIPEELRNAVAAALDSINLSSGFTVVQLANGKTKRVKDGSGEATKRTQAFSELQAVYRDVLENGGEIVVDPALIWQIDKIVGFRDTPIANLGLNDLTTVWDVVKAIEASISTYNKILGRAKFETVSEPAFGIRDYLTGRKNRGDFRGPFRQMDRLMNFGMMTPEGYFLRLGESGKGVFKMIREAQDQNITILKDAEAATRDIIKPGQHRKLEKKKHTFNFDGQTVEMTTAQIMNLYVLMGRQQAVDHIMVGGFRPDAVKKGIKDMAPPDAWHLTQDQVSEILDSLTPEETKIADGLRKYIGTELTRLGNEASMEVYGYKKFREKSYWPIETDKNQVQSDVKNDAVSGTVAGWGSAKPLTPHANNAVIVRSIFDVYADHVTGMAKYASWLATMENLNRIFNFRYKDEDGHMGGGVKTELERAFGKNGSGYWKNLMDDLNAGVKARSDNPFQALTGAYKASAIAGNIRVIVQQPTAILRALDMLNPADIAAGMALARPGKWNKTVKEYAPIAVWKDWGYFTADTGKQMRNVLFGDDNAVQRFNYFFMNNPVLSPGAADSVTWTAIWNAVEIETRRKRKDLRPKSAEYYQAVADRFNDVIDHTQVVDGIPQRSQIMRSTSDVTKMATSFMSEPTKSYNMMTSAIYEARNAKGAARGKAMAKLGRSTLALMASFAVNAAVQSIVDAVRDDDKDEEYWEKFLQAYFGEGGETRKDQVKSFFMEGNLGAAFNPATYIPFVKDILSIGQGYTVSRMDMDVISKVMKEVQNVQKAMNGEGKKTVRLAWINLAAEVSRFLGMPVANLKRDILAFSRTFYTQTGNFRMQYELEKFMYDETNSQNMGEFAKLILLAERAGDNEAAEYIRSSMISAGADGEKLDKKLASLRKTAVEDTEEYQTALAQRTDAYNTMLDADERFAGLESDRQENVRKQLDSYAKYQTLGESMDVDNDKMEKIAEAENHDIPAADWVVFKAVVNDIHGDDRKEQVLNLIDSYDISNEGKSYMYLSQGYSEKNNPYQ